MTNFEDFSMLLLVCVIFQTKAVVLRLKTTFGEMITREVEKLNFEIEMLGGLIFTCQTLPTFSNLPNVYLWFFPYPCISPIVYPIFFPYTGNVLCDFFICFLGYLDTTALF